MAKYNSFNEIAGDSAFLEYMKSEFGIDDIAKISGFDKEAMFYAFKYYTGDLELADDSEHGNLGFDSLQKMQKEKNPDDLNALAQAQFHKNYADLTSEQQMFIVVKDFIVETDKRDFVNFLQFADNPTRAGKGQMTKELKKYHKLLEEHKDWFKDQEKLNCLFPERPNGCKTRASGWGLENTERMKNAIIMAQSVLSADEFKEFMQTKNSETGQTFATCVAKNITAAKFKLARARDEKLKKRLEENLQSLEKTMNIIKKHAPYATKTKDLMEQTAESYEKMTLRPLNVSEQNTFKVGGDNTLTVKEQPDALAVKPQEDNEDKTANVDTNAKEDDLGKGGIDVKPVKEQDIIDYMFNDWFIAGFNWSTKKTLNLADSAIVATFSYFDSRPKGSPQAQAATSPTGVNSQVLRDCIGGLVDGITEERTAERCTGAINDIKNNIGKNPTEWRTTILNPLKDKAFIEKLNKEYNKSPEKFMEKLNDKNKLIKGITPQFTKMAKFATVLAALNYVANPQNLGKIPDENAASEIRTQSKIFLKDLDNAYKNMQKQIEAEYRATNKLEPDTELSEKDALNVEEKTAKAFNKKIKDMSETTEKLQKSVFKYYDADDNAKASIRLEVAKSRENLNKIMQELDFAPLEETNNSQKHSNERKGADEVAREDNKSEQIEKAHSQKCTDEVNSVEAEKNTNNTRKEDFNNRTNKGADKGKGNTHSNNQKPNTYKKGSDGYQ